jgi:hypothetical protein
MLAGWLLKQEREDDASRLHLMKTSTVTLFGALTIIMAVSIISAFFPQSMFDFNLLYPFVIGLILSCVGGVHLL